jgi:hypothetical protein
MNINESRDKKKTDVFENLNLKKYIKCKKQKIYFLKFYNSKE